MKEQVTTLKTSDITSEVFTIAPAQIDYISRIFGDYVADTMNMRTFAPKIREIARRSLVRALHAAKHMVE